MNLYMFNNVAEWTTTDGIVVVAESLEQAKEFLLKHNEERGYGFDIENCKVDVFDIVPGVAFKAFGYDVALLEHLDLAKGGQLGIQPEE